ncbi:MAG: GGDEF domain-containing response regulator [Spirochaetales bacterium]|nr:GGDEF domain-containing response regulator [Spirochaetales bacterium]
MNILIIDNNPEDRSYIKELLTGNLKVKFSIINANTLDEGILILTKQVVSLILFDLFLTDTESMSDLDKLLIMVPHIPVVVFTHLGSEDLGTKAVSRGALDYLVKGAIQSSGLIHSIRNAAVFHSLQIKTEQLSFYLKDNLESLKKVMHLGQNAEIFPNFHSISKKLKSRIKTLSFTHQFSLFLIHKKVNRLFLTIHNKESLRDNIHQSISPDNSIMYEAIHRKMILDKEEIAKILLKDPADKDFIHTHTMCIPLISGQEILGVLNLDDYSEPIYSREFLIKCTLLFTMVINAIKKNLISLELEELSLTDDVSGLYNKRYLLWELNREIRRVQRYRGTLSILHIDIDNFKSFNDTYGYKNGDTIIRKVSEQLKKLIRTTDLIGRYAGEEFIAILTETNNKGALTLNKRITTKINQTNFDIGLKNSVKINVTIQSLEYDFKIKNAKEFINQVRTLKASTLATSTLKASTLAKSNLANPPGEKKETETEIKSASPAEETTQKRVKEEIPRQATIHQQNVRIYFIEPLELISIVIDTLVKMGFESYQVDSIDKTKLLKVLDKNDRNVIFICISNQNQLNDWLEYIAKIELLHGFTIQVGVFVYSRIEPYYSTKFLERNIAVIKFSDIQADTLSVLKKILFYFEAHGRRGFVRVEAVDDSTALFTIESERKVIGARIITFSEQFFTCYFEKKDLHHIVQGRYFIKVMLRLKGIMVQISTKVLSTKKGDPQYCVMQICSALYKNKKVTFTNGLNKETKDKLHRYIRFCLKENIKKKLNMVQD